jgi:hypothetical protein
VSLSDRDLHPVEAGNAATRGERPPQPRETSRHRWLRATGLLRSEPRERGIESPSARRAAVGSGRGSARVCEPSGGVGERAVRRRDGPAQPAGPPRAIRKSERRRPIARRTDRSTFHMSPSFTQLAHPFSRAMATKIYARGPNDVRTTDHPSRARSARHPALGESSNSAASGRSAQGTDTAAFVESEHAPAYKVGVGQPLASSTQHRPAGVLAPYETNSSSR